MLKRVTGLGVHNYNTCPEYLPALGWQSLAFTVTGLHSHRPSQVQALHRSPWIAVTRLYDYTLWIPVLGSDSHRPSFTAIGPARIPVHLFLNRSHGPLQLQYRPCIAVLSIANSIWTRHSRPTRRHKYPISRYRCRATSTSKVAVNSAVLQSKTKKMWASPAWCLIRAALRSSGRRYAGGLDVEKGSAWADGFSECTSRVG